MPNISDKAKEFLATDVVVVHFYDFILTNGDAHFLTDNSENSIYKGQEYIAVPIRRSKINQNEALRINNVTLVLGDNKRALPILFVMHSISLIQKATVRISRGMFNKVTEQVGGYRELFNGVITGIPSIKVGNITLNVAEKYFDWNISLNREIFSETNFPGISDVSKNILFG